MSEIEDIRDDQIRVIGSGVRKKPLLRRRWVRVSLFLLALAVIVLLALLWGGKSRKQSVGEPVAAVEEIEPALFEPVEVSVELEETVQTTALGNRADSIAPGYVEFRDTLINDIPLRLFIPHNADMSLHIGKMDYSDTTVVYAAQAADVRADNGGIVGAFVLKGEPLAWGLSKKGYCASINGVVSVGVADNSPLFEQATEQGGYFFRQYPLVSDGVIVENEPKGKSIRRGICDRRGEIFMVETGSAESFHDFSQALVDLGVDQAVYLVGSSAYGWAVNESGDVYEFGDRNYYGGRRKQPKNTSYIVWRRR